MLLPNHWTTFEAWEGTMETKNNQYLKEVRFRVQSRQASGVNTIVIIKTFWHVEHEMKNEKWWNIAFNNTKHYKKKVKSSTVHKLKSNPNPSSMRAFIISVVSMVRVILLKVVNIVSPWWGGVGGIGIKMCV